MSQNLSKEFQAEISRRKLHMTALVGTAQNSLFLLQEEAEDTPIKKSPSFRKPGWMAIAGIVVALGTGLSCIHLFTGTSSAYERPLTADNGSPFPHKCGYISKYARLMTNGDNQLTIDNVRGNSDVMVRVFSVDSAPPVPIRTLFIKANSKFTVSDLQAGTYDVRYQHLDSGELSQSETFEVKETRESPSHLKVSLFASNDDNFERYPIVPDQFWQRL